MSGDFEVAARLAEAQERIAELEREWDKAQREAREWEMEYWEKCVERDEMLAYDAHRIAKLEAQLVECRALLWEFDGEVAKGRCRWCGLFDTKRVDGMYVRAHAPGCRLVKALHG